MAKMAYVGIREATLRDLRTIAQSMGRNIAGDLVDDLILLGVEEYHRAARIASRCNIFSLPACCTDGKHEPSDRTK